MLSSPRWPSSTTRIFSSAEKCRRVARRMSLTICSAGAFSGTGFRLIFAPDGYDDPEILRSRKPSICLTGADGGHPNQNRLRSDANARQYTPERLFVAGRISSVEASHVSKGCFTAQIAACVRFLTWILRKTALTWTLTVASVIPSLSAMTLLEAPWTRLCKMAASLVERARARLSCAASSDGCPGSAGGVVSWMGPIHLGNSLMKLAGSTVSFNMTSSSAFRSASQLMVSRIYPPAPASSADITSLAPLQFPITTMRAEVCCRRMARTL